MGEKGMIRPCANKEYQGRCNCNLEYGFGISYSEPTKKIMEKLQGREIKLPLSEDVQAKERQLKNLSAILDEISKILDRSATSDDSGIPMLVFLHFAIIIF